MLDIVAPVSRRTTAWESVFLNVPYDTAFGDLYLAYIAGLSALRLAPRLSLEVTGGQRRLNRILALIASCRYSIHDLSRIEVDGSAPATPRFNMPFELGLSVAWTELNPGKHTWFVFEAEERRIQKSLSDLNGTDIQIHENTVAGVMRELCNCFVTDDPQPSVPIMVATWANLRDKVPDIQASTGARSLYEPLVFHDLCWVAGAESRMVS